MVLLRVAILLPVVMAVAAPPSDAPPIAGEQLRYAVNWPSGLGLGEAELDASTSKPSSSGSQRMDLQFNLDAGIPGYSVSDRYHAAASSDFCSTELQRTSTHGSKKADEKTAFDSHAGTATRETSGGGKTEIQTPSCAKDALTFLYFTRHELSQGRIPPPHTVYFGSAYDIRLDFSGTQKIQVAGKPVDADRFSATARGPASEISFEVFFLHDAARTPALVRVPLTLGTFSMELVR